VTGLALSLLRTKMNTGFFQIEGKDWQRMAYRCACCKVFVMFAPEDAPRVWCCGELKQYEEPTGLKALFGNDLPREQFVVGRKPLERPRRQFEEEDEGLRFCAVGN